MSNRRVVGIINHVPFNSKHLTAKQIKYVGRVLKALKEAAATEVHVMIEGKRTELGWKVTNMQVFLSSSGMSLLDEGEEFMSIPVGFEDQSLLSMREKTVSMMNLVMR